MFGSCIRWGTHPNRRPSLCSDTESDSCRKNAFLRTRLLIFWWFVRNLNDRSGCVVFVSGDARRRRPRDMTKVAFCAISCFLFFGRNHHSLFFDLASIAMATAADLLKPFLRNSKSLLYDFSFEWVSRSELCKFRNRRIKTAAHVRSDCFSFLYRSTSKLSIYSRRFQIIASLDCCAKKTSNN